MKMIKCYIQHEKLEAVREKLFELGVPGISRKPETGKNTTGTVCSFLLLRTPNWCLPDFLTGEANGQQGYALGKWAIIF